MWSVGQRKIITRIKALPLIKIGVVLFYLCHNFLIKGDKKKNLVFPKGKDKVRIRKPDVQQCTNFVLSFIG